MLRGRKSVRELTHQQARREGLTLAAEELSTIAAIGERAVPTPRDAGNSTVQAMEEAMCLKRSS